VPDVTLFVRRQLAATPAITSLLGTGGAWPGPWLWRWQPRVSVEGTGKRAVVISRPRPWAVPSRFHTTSFDLVQVDVFADPTRDANGKPLKEDAEERALAVCDEVRKVMHVPRGAEIEWGDGTGKTRIVSSVAGQDPEVARLDDSDVVRARQAFEVVLG
jgi:hypothetical protein